MNTSEQDDDRASITALLNRWGKGDNDALQALMPLVYEQLRQLAERAFRYERNSVTLQATAVVNEAYLQLADIAVDWKDSKHFYALASRMMRRILVNHAKARRASKRGGDRVCVTYDDDAIGTQQPVEDILDLDDALSALGEIDSRKVDILELHYFAGLKYEDMAEALDISASTVKRDLRFGKAWIRKYLADHHK